MPFQKRFFNAVAVFDLKEEEGFLIIVRYSLTMLVNSSLWIQGVWPESTLRSGRGSVILNLVNLQYYLNLFINYSITSFTFKKRCVSITYSYQKSEGRKVSFIDICNLKKCGSGSLAPPTNERTLLISSLPTKTVSLDLTLRNKSSSSISWVIRCYQKNL